MQVQHIVMSFIFFPGHLKNLNAHRCLHLNQGYARNTKIKCVVCAGHRWVNPHVKEHMDTPLKFYRFFTNVVEGVRLEAVF